MWLGNTKDIPNGIFNPKDYKNVKYQCSKKVDLNVPESIFQMLTFKIPDEVLKKMQHNEIKESKTKVKKGGDCFDANGRFVMDQVGKEIENEIKLCHGIAILKTDGKPFGHCWIEVGDDVVMDKSNGNNYVGRRERYYELGGIPVKGYEKIYKYSPKEVCENALKYKTWGPWELKAPR